MMTTDKPNAPREAAEMKSVLRNEGREIEVGARAAVDDWGCL